MKPPDRMLTLCFVWLAVTLPLMVHRIHLYAQSQKGVVVHGQ